MFKRVFFAFLLWTMVLMLSQSIKRGVGRLFS